MPSKIKRYQVAMQPTFVLILLLAFLGIYNSGEAEASSWQCPGHEPSVELKRVEELPFLEMDLYRGYKPAWMAMDRVYRSAIYGWSEEVQRSAYLDSRISYLDAYMYNEKLRVLMERYPDKFEVWELARTNFGFPVYAVLVGASKEKQKADILHVAGIHGNEMITLNYSLDAIEMLLSNPEEQFSALLSRFNFWFVPMANPDGNWLSMRRAHASTYGKNNGRNTDGTCESFAYEGVDLSDNFPRKNVEIEVEAEIQGLIQLVESRNFVLGLSLHTGGKGFYTPPISLGEGEDESLTLKQFSSDIAKELPDFEIRSLMRSTNLREVVWLYKEKGIPAFIFDYPVDIAPKVPEARKLAQGVFGQFITAFWTSLDNQAFLEGIIVDQKGIPLQAQLHHKQSLRKEIVWDIPENGTFSMIFPRKDIITLQITAEGYVSAEKKIDLRDGVLKTKIVLLKEENGK